MATISNGATVVTEWGDDNNPTWHGASDVAAKFTNSTGYTLFIGDNTVAETNSFYQNPPSGVTSVYGQFKDWQGRLRSDQGSAGACWNNSSFTPDASYPGCPSGFSTGVQYGRKIQYTDNWTGTSCRYDFNADADLLNARSNYVYSSSQNSSTWPDMERDGSTDKTVWFAYWNDNQFYIVCSCSFPWNYLACTACYTS